MKRDFNHASPDTPNQIIRFFEALTNIIREVSAPDEPVEAYIDEQVDSAIKAIDLITDGSHDIPDNFIEFGNGKYTLRLDFKITITEDE